MLLIGSVAFLQYTCGSDYRLPRDIDLISTHEEAIRFAEMYRFRSVLPTPKGDKLICRDGMFAHPVEVELAWPGTSAEEILNRTTDADRWTGASSMPIFTAPLNLLYLLKMSHRYLKNSPHFEKTWNDIQYLRCFKTEIEWPDVLRQREAETYTYAHPKLDVSKKQFFNPDQLTYTYDHDTIHLAMAIDPMTPAYSKFKPDVTEVKVSRELFAQLPLDVQLASVLEESYVLALERSQIPFKGKTDPLKSFTIALQKVCTSISSGWWREFAWEHYRDVLDRYDSTYVGRFWSAVEAGIVKPFNG